MAKTNLSLTLAYPDLRLEKALWRKGHQHVGGVDEAGRGAWAGPVAAAVVILPQDGRLGQTLRGVRDSKQMTSLQRHYWAARIQAAAVDWGVGFTAAAEIDQMGIVPATRLAVMRAFETITVIPDYLLIDYLLIPESQIPQTPVVKGDNRSLSIAAASVLAKVARDGLMFGFESAYAGYGFAQNKGYGTPQHQKAIHRAGLCEIHRKSFAISR
jgi:ribonuclease HII